MLLMVDTQDERTALSTSKDRQCYYILEYMCIYLTKLIESRKQYLPLSTVVVSKADQIENKGNGRDILLGTQLAEPTKDLWHP
jgi:hypothetical protein